MARSIASATISFGMVSIPVDIYPATQSSSGISFNLLHSTCGSRLKQQYTCIKEGVVVERADMVKGYEFAEGRYVTFTKDELKALEEPPTQMVEITEFVAADAIDPIYYDKAYYLAPGKGGAKPYALLRQAMHDSQRFGLGKWAARGKQYIVQLRPVVRRHRAAAAAVCRRGAQDRRDRHRQGRGASGRAEAGDATDRADLLRQVRPRAYVDEEKKRIEAAIQKKIEGEEIAVSEEEGKGGAQIIDLMEALRASLDKGAKPGAWPSRPRLRRSANPRSAPSRRSRSRKRREPRGSKVCWRRYRP